MNLTEINLTAVEAVLTGFSSIATATPDIREKRTKLAVYLERNGLSLESVVCQLSEIVNSSAREAIKLQAIEVALKLHEVLPLSEASSNNLIQINVQGDETKIMGVITPRNQPYLEATNQS